MNKCSVAIPARLSSTRLPGKLLADLGGKPVLQHVIERVKQVRNCHAIYVVTEDEVIIDLAKSLSVEAFLTSPKCRSGSERVASMINKMEGDWVFNVQGDEPFVDPMLIEGLLDETNRVEAPLLTPVFKLHDPSELRNPNIVKVVLDHKRQCMYFSRSPIPFVRGYPESEWLQHGTFWGHIGIYGFRRDILEHYDQLKPCDLENLESLEQLRLLANQYRIATYETQYKHVAIDTQADLDYARSLLKD